MSPVDSFCCATGPRREPSFRRRSTQSGVCPSSFAMALGDRPSSLASDDTTRASSNAVIVRGGALATSSSRLCSMGEAGVSTTTGTTLWPNRCQRPMRLNPSITW
jgi:hypothetical protein